MLTIKASQKKITRRGLLSAAILTALICSLLTGCGQTKAETPAPTPEPTAAPTEAPAPEATAPPGIKVIEITPEPTAEPTPEPTEEPAAEAEEAPAEEAAAVMAVQTVPGAVGQYTYADKDGDWVLDLRDNSVYTLTDPDGKLHTGESWTLNEDGTVDCGPTDIYGAPFAFNGGCSRWAFMRGNLCFPVKHG